jgi:hypothetical protein
LSTPAIAATKKPSLVSIGAQQIKAKNLVRANFGNIKGVSKVSYTLMYDSNGVGQGAGGSFVPGKKTSFSRDIFLGTCSGKVCVKHKNVKNLKLLVTLKYPNGKSSSKTYNVK